MSYSVSQVSSPHLFLVFAPGQIVVVITRFCACVCFQGQCFVAINPENFASGFSDRMSDLLSVHRNMDPVSRRCYTAVCMYSMWCAMFLSLSACCRPTLTVPSWLLEIQRGPTWRSVTTWVESPTTSMSSTTWWELPETNTIALYRWLYHRLSKVITTIMKTVTVSSLRQCKNIQCR